jgi:hypothetical protein
VKLIDKILNFLKGGKVENKKLEKKKEIKSDVEKIAPGATPLWIGTTVVFALLFFLSSVLDMKVNVSFGQGTGTKATPTTTQQLQSQPAPSSGAIADQVGGC